MYAEHGGPLCAFWMRWTGDVQRAQDVVQEALLRAWRNLLTLDVQTRPLRPWLLTVVRYVLTDAHLVAQARPVLVDDEHVLAAAAAPEEMDRAVESWQVAAALQRLTPDHREVLVQAHWMGCSVAETAVLLGIPAGTVQSRTFYAVQSLRLALEEIGVAI